MKLLREYKAGVTVLIYLVLGVFSIYFLLFWKHITDLMAGGFIFMYFTFFLSILNRYFREIFMWITAKSIHIKASLNLKTIDPSCRPRDDMNYKQLLIFEFTPIIVIMSFYTILSFITFLLYPDWYYTKVIFGTTIVSILVFYSNYSRIITAISYGKCIYRYTNKTLKIYKDDEGYIPASNLDCILKDDLKFKNKMK